MAALQDREAKYNEEKKLFSCLVNLLSYEKITFNGELNFRFSLCCGEVKGKLWNWRKLLDDNEKATRNVFEDSKKLLFVFSDNFL
jgi:hypothetical protein